MYPTQVVTAAGHAPRRAPAHRGHVGPAGFARPLRPHRSQADRNEAPPHDSSYLRPKARSPGRGHPGNDRGAGLGRCRGRSGSGLRTPGAFTVSRPTWQLRRQPRNMIFRCELLTRLPSACGCRELCHGPLISASLPDRPQHRRSIPPSMIASCGLPTRLPDARSRPELAGTARPLRRREGRRDSDPASRQA
jgi:hypothetical protein